MRSLQGKRKEKTTPSGVNLMRSQVLYRAAQELRGIKSVLARPIVPPCRGEYCTVSSDGTIRGWDIASHAQLFELAAPGEVIQCCAYHPDRHELACGFDQGRVRIFDIAETALLQEHKQHRQGVLQVLYLPSGKLLFSLGELPPLPCMDGHQS